MTEDELNAIAELVLSAPPGKNVVYYSGTQGWSKMPHPLRSMISSMVSEGLITVMLRREGPGTFSMVSQRSKKKPAKTKY